MHSSPLDWLTTPSDLLVAASCVFGAAAIATASGVMGAMPPSRQRALAELMSGSVRRAMNRYLSHRRRVELSWFLGRTAGALAAGLHVYRAFGAAPRTYREVGTIVVVLVTYGCLSELLMAIGERLSPARNISLLRWLLPLDTLLLPLTLPLLALGRLCGRTGIPVVAQDLAETEMEMLVDDGEQAGTLDRHQSEIIRHVLGFRDLTVGDLMVPRTRVEAFGVNDPGAQVLQKVLEDGHSRYPVYRGTMDNIVGILHATDLFRYTIEHGGVEDVKLGAIMQRPVAFVAETQLASSVLRDMRAGKHHLVVVIDEFGGTSGIVTLEDLLEEIVGDIRDEDEMDEDPFVKSRPDGSLLVDAAMPIFDLERRLNVSFPELGDYNSLGGFILQELGEIPTIGVEVSHGGYTFRVEDADERHIALVGVRPRRPAPSSPDASE